MGNVTQLSLVSEDETKAALRNVPQLLRTIAGKIETGTEPYDQLGPDDVIRGVPVMRIARHEPIVYGLGDIAHIAQSFEDLHAGAQHLMSMTHPERG